MKPFSIKTSGLWFRLRMAWFVFRGGKFDGTATIQRYPQYGVTIVVSALPDEVIKESGRESWAETWDLIVRWCRPNTESDSTPETAVTTSTARAAVALGAAIAIAFVLSSTAQAQFDQMAIEADAILPRRQSVERERDESQRAPELRRLRLFLAPFRALGPRVQDLLVTKRNEIHWIAPKGSRGRAANQDKRAREALLSFDGDNHAEGRS